MEFKSIFVDSRNIIRSGWRFGIFFAGFLILSFFFGAAAWLILAVVIGQHDPMLSEGVSGFFSLIPALLAGWLCGKLLEGLPFRSLGAWFTKFWLEHLSLGVIIGAATLLFAVLVAMALGGLRFTPNPDRDGNEILASLSVSLLVFAVGAAFEEALFRGYILQTFNRSGLGWLAIMLTSVFFGLAHIRNPDPTILSTLNTILAGVWFSVAYLKTRDLWFVWGMHLVWNWMQGSIFGIDPDQHLLARGTALEGNRQRSDMANGRNLRNRRRHRLHDRHNYIDCSYLFLAAIKTERRNARVNEQVWSQDLNVILLDWSASVPLA